jgi:PIN domain nuclease of toxin-antitoxin system
MLAQTLEQQAVEVVEPGLEDHRLAGGLPLLHRDPFDRLLVAVALRRGLIIVTMDAAIPPYGAPTAWG